MAAVMNGDAPVEIDVDPAVFQSFADLEKEFAKVELDALRRKEFALRNLYTKRNALSSQIPNFWPAVLMNGPQELQTTFGESDHETLAAVKSVNVERYQITSETEGDPRSLRFTFEFDENDWFEDTKVVKEFRFVENINNDAELERDVDDDGPVGALVSVPLTFKWKKRGKKMNNGLLDLAVNLYRAEEAVRLTDSKSGRDLQVVERESLWQYEKLREQLRKLDAENEGGPDPTWLDWFGYRGPVIGKKLLYKQGSDQKASKTNGNGAVSHGDEKNKKGKSDENGDHDMENDESSDDDGDSDGLLDVEVYPIGEEIANVLADDLWPNVMDYFMASQQDPIGDDFDGLDSDEDEDEGDDEDENDAPELVEVEEAKAEEDESRPAKRQKKA